MKRYKVLWIDDQYDEFEVFIDHADHQGIDIKPYYTAREGMQELEKNLNEYDAVILDAKCWSESTVEVADTAAMYSSIRKIHELRPKRDLPYFVFTGQPDLMSNTEFVKAIGRDKYYKKGSPDSINELLKDISTEASRQPFTQVQYKYQSVLAAFDRIGQDTKDNFFEVLMALEGHKDLNHTAYYTSLRIVLEGLFRHAYSIGLLHDKCIEKGKVNLSESSLFLAGESTKYLGVKCSKSHFPKLIAENVKNLLFITGGASHTVEPDKKDIINLQEYWKLVNSPYLLYAQTLVLCDILLWYDVYAKQNEDREQNVKLWLEDDSEAINGIVEKDTNGNYHCGNCFMLSKNAEKDEGKMVTVIDKNLNTNVSTKDLYPYFALKWE